MRDLSILLHDRHTPFMAAKMSLRTLVAGASRAAGGGVSVPADGNEACVVTLFIVVVYRDTGHRAPLVDVR